MSGPKVGVWVGRSVAVKVGEGRGVAVAGDRVNVLITTVASAIRGVIAMGMGEGNPAVRLAQALIAAERRSAIVAITIGR